MHDFFRKWTGRCWKQLWDMECNEIKPGHLLRLYHFPLLAPPLTSSDSYLWRAEKGKGRATMLVSVTTGQRVPMSRTMATLLVKVEEPAWLNPADYAEELRWAELHGYGFQLTTTQRGRGLQLLAEHQGDVGTFRFTAADVRAWKRSPETGRALLTDALFWLLHPIRARRLHDAGGQMPAKTRAAFVKQLRLRVVEMEIVARREQQRHRLAERGFDGREHKGDVWGMMAIGALVDGRLMVN